MDHGGYLTIKNSINNRVLTRFFFFFINEALRTARCKNSLHLSRVEYDQTMDQTAGEKRTLQFMRDGRVRLRIEREEKNIRYS